MNEKTLMRALLLITGFVLCPFAMAAQSESPVACVEGSEPLNLVYGDHTTGCEINPVLDLDRFTFDATDGDDVRIILRTFANRPDPRLEVRDPDGVVISDTFCGTTTSFPCTLSVPLSLVKTGEYSVAVSDQSSSGTGTYTLQIEKVPPVVQAPGIAYDSPVSDEVDPVTDLDFFTFEANSGTDIRIVVRSFANRPDPRLEVWDPNGDQVINTFCGTTTSFPCTISEDLSPISGTYLVAISDATNSGTGDYDITIQCLFGDCPPPPTRAECDIQMSQQTYIDGETARADSILFTNMTGAAVSVEWKIWLIVPGISPIGVVNIGADGSRVFQDGTSLELGPLDLFTIMPNLPRGSYEFSCRLLDPTTGRLLLEDRNFFDVQ